MSVIVLDACIDNLCENGGTCVAVNDGETMCACPERWTGDRCQIGMGSSKYYYYTNLSSKD